MPAALPPGLRIYAIGDIHGRSDLMDELHGRIVADAAARPAAHCRIVYLGDYVDRGPDSRGVIERLLAPAPDGFERVALLGNHEAMLLDALADRYAADHWLRNGGGATLQSYGLPAASSTLAFLRALPRLHRGFLERLALSHRAGAYHFVHAGIEPGVPLDAQPREALIWIRGRFLDSTADHGAVVVHGHTPVDAVEWRPNRIGIDTGAYFTGRLTALVLEGDGSRLLQTGRAGLESPP